MDVNPFLDYLRDHEATRDLAKSLRAVLALRNRPRLIPAEASAPRTAARRELKRTAVHGLRLGRIRGIELRLDWSVAIILGLLTWLLATEGLPAIAPGYPRAAYWAASFVSAIAFFATLLAHEIAHAVVAQRRGLQVTDITLWVFGGVARIGGEARTPRDDFAIAVVGPLASFTISVLASMLLLGMYLLGVPGIVVASVAWLSSMNFILAVFNLAPAAPLDGGRLLRAWLWHRSGDHDAAARKATRAGEVLAWLLVVSGLVELALGGARGRRLDARARMGRPQRRSLRGPPGRAGLRCGAVSPTTVRPRAR